MCVDRCVPTEQEKHTRGPNQPHHPHVTYALGVPTVLNDTKLCEIDHMAPCVCTVVGYDSVRFTAHTKKNKNPLHSQTGMRAWSYVCRGTPGVSPHAAGCISKCVWRILFIVVRDRGVVWVEENVQCVARSNAPSPG